MAHSFKLVAVLLAAFSASAHAGYAQLSPPPGFGGSPGNWTYAPSANDVRYGATVHSPNALRVPVPGTSATMSASYRFAANAPRFAAAALYISPHLRAAAGIAAWLGLAKIFWDEAEQLWKIPGKNTTYPVSDGLEWTVQVPKYFPTKEQACATLVGTGGDIWAITSSTPSYNGQWLCRNSHANGQSSTQQLSSRVSQSCPAGGYITPEGCLITLPPEPLTPKRFEDELAPLPMPQTVPFELPKPTPLPIQQPIINPEPTENPQPRPLFVPTGDPVPNPQYDPNTAPGPNNQPWIQPGTKVTPSPTPSEPWRVDIEPVKRPVPGPEPMPGPEPYPPPNPNPDPNNPNPDPNSPDKPKPEELQSLCEKHPDILACEKLKLGDAGEPKDVPDEKKELAINKDTGWGQENGTCPAPRTVQIRDFTLEMPFTLLCDFASGIRPVVIGLAWLAAAFTFMGIGRRS